MTVDDSVSTAVGVKVTEQEAAAPDPESSHELALKLPPSDSKLTGPVGVLGVPPSVSLTIAVHVDDCPTTTMLGEQLTLVEVERTATE